MGICSPSLKRNACVPPSDAAASPTLLTGGDPNVMRVAGGSDPAASNDDVQVAQQRRPQSTPSDAGSLAGRDSSKMYLKFNGRSLSLYDGDSVVAQWPGVSGRENFGSGKDQEKAGQGPIPEGTYDIKQSRYEQINARNALYGLVPRDIRATGQWPGSVMGWGTERVWADPTKETVDSGLTFGRKDMAIHGGWVPGSAGCIDLTGNMASFAKSFRSLGYDLKLYVDYNKTPP
jgi:hypothetical protein